MVFQALISGGRLHVKFPLDSNVQLGSPEFVNSVITICKTHLERSDCKIERLIIYECIHALMRTAFQYEGDIQLEIIQLALEGITSLRQDANMPQYVQKILDDLESLYQSEAYSSETKSDGVDDVVTGCCRQPAAMAWRFQPTLEYDRMTELVAARAFPAY
ncbi:hypothetical protein V500_02866 [Pseudogymnoascus sp. VKM F-4518 (FW-2643)]|nr:hypothetical protein V500_02866 [Pseudogymnoascus sp. VKM F-4518 (FW-2643)]